MPENEVGFLPNTIYKNQFKWTKDLNIRLKTPLLEKKPGGKFQNIGFRSDFLDMTPKSQA